MNNVSETKEFLDDVSKYLFLNIKYNNTEPNKAIHKAFTQFCWDNVDGSYLQGLKLLMDNFALDYKYESLFLQIEDLKSSVVTLAEQLKEKPVEKKEERKFFGERN
jgi:hypothetical protein